MTATAGREAQVRDLEDVLAGAGSRLSVGDLAAGLRSLLAGALVRDESPMTAAEAAYLREHSGLPVEGGEDLARAAVNRGVQAVTQVVATSLSAAEVAARADVDASTVRHWVGRGEVLSVAARGKRFPAFQFGEDGRPLPGLREVLAALPEGLHPLSVDRLMTSPDTDLVVEGRPVSPREWLLAGGDPAAVVAVAGTVAYAAGTHPPVASGPAEVPAARRRSRSVTAPDYEA
jgi:hypothetical protein